MALAVIMVRAGLGLDLDKLLQLGLATARLAILPCVSEALTISLNGEAYLDPRLSWTYYAPPTVSALQPADGPASGGQIVTVRGDGFLNLATAGAAAARLRAAQL